MASCVQPRLRWESRMKGSRFIALGVVAAAALWIASGHFFPRETVQSRTAVRASETEQKKPFRVAVTRATVIAHARRLTLSGRTEADKRVVITARAAGVLTELRVKRGMWVQKDDIIAVLSDEAREAQVAQAEAVVTQKRTELDAKRQLIINGTLPRLQLVDLEAQLKAAEASLAAAQAERDRGVVRAPWSGVVQDLAVEVGQAAFSFTGRELATLVSLDPMLVIVEVAERKLAGMKVGEKAQARLVTGEVVAGKIRIRRQDRQYRDAHLSGRSRTAEQGRQHPGRDHGGSIGALAAGPGDANPTLGADIFSGRGPRRPNGGRARQGGVRAGRRRRGRAVGHVGRRARAGDPGDCAGTGLRSRGTNG